MSLSRGGAAVLLLAALSSTSHGAGFVVNGATVTITAPAQLITSGDLTITKGTLTLGNGAPVSIGGNWDASGGVFDGTASSVTFNGSSSGQLINPGKSNFYKLLIAGSGDWSTSAKPVTVSSGIVISAGLFTVAAGATATVAGTIDVQSAGALAINADMGVNGGTLSNAGFVTSAAPTATVRLSGAGTIGGSGSTTLPGLTLVGTSQTTTLVSSLTVTGDLVIPASRTLDVSAANYELGVGRSLLNSGTLLTRAGTVAFVGSAAGSLIQTNHNAFDNVSFEGAGAWTGAGGAIDVAGALDVNSGTFTIVSAATVTVQGAASVESGGWLNIDGDMTVNGGSFDNNGTIASLSTATLKLNGNGALGGAGASALPKLTLSGASMTTTLEGPASVAGQLTIPAGHTLDVNDSGSYDLTLSSDFLNSGSFTPQSGTVIFAGTSSLTGQTTFYDLEDTLPGTVIILPAGSVTTVANELTLSGSAGNMILLKSSSAGTPAGLNVGPVANYGIASVNVKDSHAVGQALTASASTNGGNNTRWTFGTTRTWVGPGNWSTAANWSPAGVPDDSDSVLFGNAANCTIDISTTVAQVTLQAGYTGTITANQNLTVSGGFLQAGGTFNQGGTTLTIGGNWGLTGGTFNPGTGTTLFNATSTGRTLSTHQQSFYNVVFNGAGGYWTMQDSMTVLGSLTLTAGTLDTKASSFATSIGAEWLNGGGAFVVNASSVSFTGTGTGRRIDPGASPFYKLLITGTGGWQTDSDPVVVSSAVSVTGGTLTVVAGSSLTVAGGLDVRSGATLALNTDAGIATLANAGTVTSSAGTLTLTGTGALGGTGSTRLTNLFLTGAGSTVLSGAVTAQGTLTNDGGHTLDVSGTGYAVTVSSAWANAGTFNAQGGSVTFNGSAAGLPIDPGGSSFYKLVFAGSGGWITTANPVTVSSAVFLNAGTFTVSPGSTLTVAGGLDIKSGATLAMNADITVDGGSLTNAGTLLSDPAATLTLDGAGTLGGAGMTRLPNVGFTGTAKTTTLGGAITVQSDLANGAGHTLDASASNFAVTLTGSWANSGTYAARASSVTFNAATGSLTIASDNSPFYKMSFVGAGSWTTATSPLTVSSAVFVNAGNFTVASGSSLTVAGGVDVKSGAALMLNADAAINGGALSNAGSVTADPSTTLTLAGDGILGGAGSTLVGNLTLSGSAQTTTLGGPVTLQGDLTNGAAHTLDASAANYGLTVGGGWTNSGAYAARASSVTFNGGGSASIISGGSSFYNVLFNGAGGWTTATNPVTVSSNAIVAGGSLTVSGSTLTVTGTLDVQAGGALNINANLAVNGGTLTNEGTINSLVTSTLTLAGSGLLGGPGTTTLPKLILTGNAQTTTLGGPITVQEALNNNSGHTLDVASGGNYQITASSSWINTGTFVPETGTVLFTGTGTISGSSTFYNFSAITGGNTMIFIANSVQTVNGALQINGASGNLIQMVSSTGGTLYSLKSTGAADLLYLSVKDCNASGNKLNASASTDSGNNLNWTFGTTKTWTGGGTNTKWSTAANWSPSGAPGALDSAIFTAPASRNCVIDISTTVAQITIQSNFPTNRTISANAGLALGVNGDFTQAAGTMTLTSGSFNVGGNWIHTGGVFGAGTSVITFNSNSGQTIRSGGRPFNNVVFNGVGGYWTLQDSMTVISSMTLTNGALDTNPAGNYGISIGLDWLNNGGTFIGNQSTVTFNAATSGRGITSGGDPFGNVIFNGSGATWTLADALSAQDLTLTAGTLNTYSLGNFPITIAGDAAWNGGTLTLNGSSVTAQGGWTYAGTTFDLGTSTVAFTGAGAKSINAGGQAFYNLTFNDAGGQWTTISNPITVQNLFSVQAGTFTLANAAPSAITGDVAIGPAGTWTVDADVSVAGGDVLNAGVIRTDAATATLTLNGTGALGGAGSTTLPGLQLNGAAQTTTLAGPLTVAQALDIGASHTLNAAAQALTFTGAGTPFTVHGAWTSAGSTVTYAPSIPVASVTVASTTFGDVRLNGSGAAFALSGATGAGTLSILAGTLDATASNWQLTLSGGWSDADTFNARAGSVTFTGAGSGWTIDPGASPFYKLAFGGTGAYATANHSLNISSSVFVDAGNFAVSPGSTLTVAGDVAVEPGATLTLNADAAINGGSLANAGTVAANPAVTLTLGGTGVLGGSGGTLLPNLATAGSGQTTLGGPIAVQGVLANAGGHTLDASAANYAITISSSWTNSGTYAARAGSVTFNGASSGQSVDPGASAFYRLLFNGSGDWTTTNNPVTVSSAVTISGGNLIIAAGSSVTVAGNLDIGPAGTLNVNADLGVNGGSLTNAGTLGSAGTPTLTLSGAGTLGGSGAASWPKVALNGAAQTTTLGGAAAFAGLLTIGAGHTLDANAAGNYDITVSSGWVNNGTFQGRAAQVIAAGNLTFAGSTTFNDLTSTTPGLTLTFTAGSTQTVTGVFTITGASGNTIKLRSSTLLQPYYIKSSGSASVSYANVQDSVASGSTLNASASTDSGHNVNWTFGTNYVWIGPGNFSVAGNWNPPGNPGPIDSVRFNNANNCTIDVSTTITRLEIDNTYSGSITLNQDLTLNGNFSQAGGALHAGAHTLSIGTSWSETGGVFDAGTSTVVFTAASAGRTIASNGQPFYNATFNGPGGYWTLQDSMTALGNLALAAGVLDQGTSDGVSVGGDWINTGGGFAANAGTATFIAASGGRRIFSGGVPFGGMVFSGAGSWTPYGAPLTANGNVTLANGSTLTSADASSSTLGGLTLNSGTAFSMKNDVTLNGSFANAGTFTALSTTTLEMAGAGSLGGASVTRLPRVDFAAGAQTTLAGAVTVLSGLSIQPGAALDVGGAGYAITVSSAWANAGTFNAQGGSVTFNGAAAGLTIDPGSASFYKLAFTGSGSWFTANNAVTASSAIFLNAGHFTVSPGSTLTVAGGLDVKSGATLTLNADAAVNGGALTNAGTILSDPAATLTMSGSGVLGGAGLTRLPHVIFVGAAQTTTLGGPVTLQSDLTNGAAHTLDASASNYGLTLAGSWTNTGLFTARTSSVTFTGANSSLAIASGSSAFYKLAFAGSGGWATAAGALTVSSAVFVNAGTFTVASGSTLTVAGGVDVKSGATLALNADAGVNGGSISNAGTILADPAAMLTLAGTGILGGAGTTMLPALSLAGSAQTTTLGGPVTLLGDFSNAAAHTLDASATNFGVTAGGGWSNSGLYAAHSSSVTFNGAGTVNLVSGNSAFYNLVFNGAGTWTTATNAVTVSSNVAVVNGTFAVSGSTLTVAGVLNVQSGGTLAINANVLVNGGSLTNAGTITSVVTSTLTLSGAGTLGGAGTTTLPKLILAGAAQTTTLAGPITVQEALTNNGGHTLDANAAGNYQITASSSWVNAGTFTARTGTVVFAGDGSLTGQTSFYNFSALTPDIALIFPASSTQTVTGALVLNGTSGGLLTLRSSVSGTVFCLNSTGAADILYVDVKDSKATGNKLNASASTNSGDTINWTFGTSHQWTGTTSTSWNVATNWTPNGVPGALDIVTFDGAATKNCVLNISTSVAQIVMLSTFTTRTLTFNAGVTLGVNGDFRQAGGVVTFSNPITLTVGGNMTLTGGTFTPGAGTVFFNANTPGQTLTSSGRVFNNVTFNGAGGYWTQKDSMTLGGTLTLTAGTLDTGAASNAIALKGDWLNNGGLFTASGSTVVFNATTAGHLITSNGNAFANLQFNGAGGGWTPQDDLTVNGHLTLTAGTLDGGARVITLSGNWTGSGGTFSADTSTVTFSGAAASLSQLVGSTTFYNLQCVAPGKILQFQSAQAQGVSGLLTLAGVSGNLLQLRSTNDPVTWFLNATGAAQVGYVDVKASNAAGGVTLYAGKSSVDSTGNSNWVFDYAPAAITNLTASPQSDGSMQLTWTAPEDADDEPLGAGSQYAIQWATYSVTASTSNASLYISTSGVSTGDAQMVVSTGLVGSVAYNFRIWTQDPNGLWSAVSNTANATVTPVLSVVFSTNTYAFGLVNLGATTISTAPIAVTNGGNVSQTYVLSVSTTGPLTIWSVGTGLPNGMDQFVLFGAFNSGQPNVSSFGAEDVLISTPTAATGSIYSAGGQSGVSVPQQGSLNLWLRLNMPPMTTTTDSQQMKIDVTATTP